jgi:hypothetical protein
LPESKHEAIGISDTEAAQELTNRGLSLEQSVTFCRWVVLQLAHFGKENVLSGAMSRIILSRGPMQGLQYTLTRLLVEEAQAIAQQQKPDHIVRAFCRSLHLQLRDPAMHDIPPVLWNSMRANGILDPHIISPSQEVFPSSVYSLLGFKPPHQSTDAEAPTPNLPTPHFHFDERSLAGWTRLRKEPAGAQSIEGFRVDTTVLEMKQAAGIPLCPHDYDLQRELRLAKHAITEALAEHTQRHRQTYPSHDSTSSYRLEKWRQSVDQCTRQHDSVRQ